MALNGALLAQIQSIVAPLTAEERLSVIRTIATLPANGAAAPTDEPPDAMLMEQEAWFAQPASVREPYRGRYIAVRAGEVVDQDTS